MLDWGKRSAAVWETVVPDLKRVFDRALAWGLIDMSAIQGRRSREEQDRFFREGKSRVKWPNGKHNVLNPGDLAEAVDVAPYINGVSWLKEHCIFMAGVVLAAAEVEGVKIRWGGNWDQDREPITDQDFQDLVHFERVKA